MENRTGFDGPGLGNETARKIMLDAQLKAFKGVPVDSRLLKGADDPLLAPRSGKFFGRLQEVDGLLSFLEGSGQARQVTHVGGGPGMGKTELCKAALREFLRVRPRVKVYYVELAGATDLAGLLGRLVSCFDLSGDMGPDKVLAFIRSQAVILYLDNLEDVLEHEQATDFLKGMLQQSRIKVLSSTRKRLDGFGEVKTLARLGMGAAVALFFQHWGADAVLDQESEEGGRNVLVAFLEKELDFHPLSIVIVASSRDRFGSFKAVRAAWELEWNRVATLLGTEPEKPEARVMSLEVSIRFSERMVAEDEHAVGLFRLWGAMSFFPEGMREEAFNTLFKEEMEAAKDWREKLIQLNLLGFREGKLDMLAALRQFFQGRMKETDGPLGYLDVLTWVKDYFIGIVGSLEIEKAGEVRTFLLQLFDEEYENLADFYIRLIDWGDPEAGILELHQSMLNYYQWRGYQSLSLLNRLASFLKSSDQEGKYLLALADCLRVSGDLERRLGNPGEARSHYELAQGYFEGERDMLGLANVLRSLGDLELRLGNPDEARSYYELAQGHFEGERDMLGLANVLWSLGDLELRLGNLDEARSHYELAQGYFEGERVMLGLANVLQSLGDLERRLDNLDEARSHYELAQGYYEGERAMLGLANVLRSLGDLEVRLGNLDEARSHYELAQGHYEGARNMLGLANVNRSLGQLLLAMGKTEEAIPIFEVCKSLYQSEQDQGGEASIEYLLGKILLEKGEVKAGYQAFQNAIRLFNHHQNPVGLAIVLPEWAELLMPIDEVQARATWETGRRYAEKVRDPNLIKDCLDIGRRLGFID